ncbi:MAG: GTP-binding protein [Solirubrobacterales bacterium]|nr:GTP-binding protein [Solirubrobacterales bacterium]
MTPRPVTVITGFLGSGKTTLIARMLGEPELDEAAVIVNELGEVALDHDLVRPMGERAIAVAGGCACCARRADLVDALRDLGELDDRGRRPVRRVVIETSGLADPAPILATIASDPVLRHQYSVQTVIAVVDAIDGAAQLELRPEARAQAAAADWLVISKGDLAGADRVDALRRRLIALNPAARVVEATRGQMDVVPLLESHSPSRTADPCVPARHGAGAVRTVALNLDHPLDWTVFGVWLSMLVHAHGERMLRFKALVDAGGTGPVELDGVRHIIHPPIHHDRWRDGVRDSRLVFIVDGLDSDDLLASLHAFQRHLTPDADEAATPW